MTPEVELVLQQLMAGNRSLWELYQRWVVAGKGLGDLVKERSRIEELCEP